MLLPYPTSTGCWFGPVPLSTAPVPLRHTVRSSRAGIRNAPQARRASVCGSASGVALHSTLRSTFPARRPQTEAKSSAMCGLGKLVSQQLAHARLSVIEKMASHSAERK